MRTLKPRRQVKIRIPLNILLELYFHAGVLPADTQFIRAELNADPYTIDIVIESNMFPEADPLNPVPWMTYRLNRY